MSHPSLFLLKNAKLNLTNALQQFPKKTSRQERFANCLTSMIFDLNEMIQECNPVLKDQKEVKII